jgi:hypothetical protein
MIAAAIVAFFVGMVLAQRFRIFVVIPLLALAAFAAFVAIFATGADTWYSVLIAVVAAVGLQIGYLFGAAMRAWGIFTSAETDSSSPAPDKVKSSANTLTVH